MGSQYEDKLSRRGFLKATVVTGMAAGSSVAASGKPAPARSERERLERLLQTYGSELGKRRSVR